MKLTVKRSLSIAFILFAFLIVATLGLSFLRIDRKVAIQGDFVYRKVQPVICEESGFVAEILIPDSGIVKAGDPVVTLVNDDLDMEIRMSENRLKVHRMELEEMLDLRRLDSTVLGFDASSLLERIMARKEHVVFLEGVADTKKELFESKLASKDDYDRALLELKDARSEVNRLEIDLKKAESRLAEKDASALLGYSLKSEELEMEGARLAFLIQRRERLSVISPAEGRFVSENIEKWKGTYLNKGTHIGDVVSFDDINFRGRAAGTDVIRVAEGQPVYFNVELFRRRNLITGTVTRVGSGVPDSSGFTIEIEVDNRAFFDRGRELFLQAGISGEAIVITEKDVSLIRMVWERVVRIADVY